jgi:uncharacterized membrane protein YoaK (UPF0700 family)
MARCCIFCCAVKGISSTQERKSMVLVTMLSVSGGFPGTRTLSGLGGVFWAHTAGEKRTSKLVAAMSDAAEKRKLYERCMNGSPYG